MFHDFPYLDQNTKNQGKKLVFPEFKCEFIYMWLKTKKTYF